MARLGRPFLPDQPLDAIQRAKSARAACKIRATMALPVAKEGTR
jgi:hypothetical protein